MLLQSRFRHNCRCSRGRHRFPAFAGRTVSLTFEVFSNDFNTLIDVSSRDSDSALFMLGKMAVKLLLLRG